MVDEAFHTFLQICKGLLVSFEFGVMPNISIFMSPSTSIGIGWDRLDEGIITGLLMSVIKVQTGS